MERGDGLWGTDWGCELPGDEQAFLRGQTVNLVLEREFFSGAIVCVCVCGVERNELMFPFLDFDWELLSD